MEYYDVIRAKSVDADLEGIASYIAEETPIKQ
jgi:hypothetical protein